MFYKSNNFLIAVKRKLNYQSATALGPTKRITERGQATKVCSTKSHMQERKIAQSGQKQYKSTKTSVKRLNESPETEQLIDPPCQDELYIITKSPVKRCNTITTVVNRSNDESSQKQQPIAVPHQAKFSLGVPVQIEQSIDDLLKDRVLYSAQSSAKQYSSVPCQDELSNDTAINTSPSQDKQSHIAASPVSLQQPLTCDARMDAPIDSKRPNLGDVAKSNVGFTPVSNLLHFN